MPLTPTERYDDIIDLPHHRSRTHPHMPRANRITTGLDGTFWYGPTS